MSEIAYGAARAGQRVALVDAGDLEARLPQGDCVIVLARPR